MDNFYRNFIPIMLWLGVAAFALAVFLVAFSMKFPFALTPGGLVRGAQALLLIAIAGYCAHLTAHNQ
ncbi:MAG: hypothetical protein ACHQ7N_17600 [Candidatus Methylomirabilales bacterium]